ncbi:hypothetical protein LOK49_Contig58G00009 [Camellia lanceoleosa]|nr:hypothetical protein LOK49_Contig58G00009 [Camellia lanceoleosa]
MSKYKSQAVKSVSVALDMKATSAWSGEGYGLGGIQGIGTPQIGSGRKAKEALSQRMMKLKVMWRPQGKSLNERSSHILNGLEMEKMKKEREEIEIVKNELEGLLKKLERKGKEMENKMAQLHKELEASEQMIIRLKEKTLNDLNGKAIAGAARWDQMV